MPLNPLGPIRNAADVSLGENPGTLPNVSDAMLAWFQPLTFGVIVKTVVNFNVVEDAVDTEFFGVWQPFTPRQLAIRPEGERKWPWFTLHALPSPSLQPDDIVIREGVQYRVMSKKNYSQYGFNEYTLTQDYSGSGPGNY